MTRTLGIIPARGGSKRVPGKNLRLLGGRPLVDWTLEAATRARLDFVALSSDEDAILARAASWSTVTAIRRPPELATDTSPAIDYVRHALEVFRTQGCPEFDAVVILQPSSPLTLASDIDGVLDLLIETQADSAVSIMQVEHAIHPLKLKRLVAGNRLEPYLEEERGRMAQHELPVLHVRNGAVYASRASTVARGDLLGRDSRGFVMPRARSVDINDELDFAFCEFLLSRGTKA